jgi:hypothetical protein
MLSRYRSWMTIALLAGVLGCDDSAAESPNNSQAGAGGQAGTGGGDAGSGGTGGGSGGTMVTMCAPTCDSSRPCPDQNGPPITCNTMGRCRAQAPNACELQ